MDILLNKAWSTYQNNFREKSKTHNFLKRNTLGNHNFLFLFKLIIQSILFDYEALIVPLFFTIKQQPWFGWENSLFSHSSYKFVLSTGCWAATNTWETNIWWLYIQWFNFIPECQGRTVECLVRMCCDIILVLHILTQTIEKIKENHLFCMKPTTIQKGFIVKVRKESIAVCKVENSE